MKLHIRIDRVDTHSHMTVFVNGAQSGKLVMTPDEARTFRTSMTTRMAGCQIMDVVVSNVNPLDVNK